MSSAAEAVDGCLLTLTSGPPGCSPVVVVSIKSVYFIPSNAGCLSSDAIVKTPGGVRRSLEDVDIVGNSRSVL